MDTLVAVIKEMLSVCYLCLTGLTEYMKPLLARHSYIIIIIILLDTIKETFDCIGSRPTMKIRHSTRLVTVLMANFVANLSLWSEL